MQWMFMFAPFSNLYAQYSIVILSYYRAICGFSNVRMLAKHAILLLAGFVFNDDVK